MRTDGFVQIDVTAIKGDTAVCNLYTPAGAVKIVMRREDYEYLCQNGFFIWTLKESQGKQEINTTKAYYIEDKKKIAESVN
jgi:hypothetical protein